MEFLCVSSPSNPAAEIKWETHHDDHDAAKAPTVIEVNIRMKIITSNGNTKGACDDELQLL